MTADKILFFFSTDKSKKTLIHILVNVLKKVNVISKFVFSGLQTVKKEEN